MSETEETWGVAVELSEDHAGPLRFAACVAGSGDSIVGVHVIPDLQRVHPLISSDQARSMRERITSDVALMLQQSGTRAKTHVETVENDQPERGLVELAAREHFDALIIGRRARSDDEPMIRLGPICRRVLRELPGPVIVVPPDFGEDGPCIDDGPVVLATDLGSPGVAATEFAKRLAARLERPLLVAHGIPAFNWGVSYIPAETFELLLEQARDRARVTLRAWMQTHGLADAQDHVFTGDPVRNLAKLARDRQAAALVTGSRKLKTIERIFVASVSSELAASAHCPTAIVPD